MDERILIILLIVNLIIGILVLGAQLIKREKTKAFLLFFLILVAPVIAPMYLFLAFLIGKIFYQKEIDFNDLSFRRERLEMITSPEYDKEIDVVPVEEALLISNNVKKRRVVLNVLKEDYQKSLATINAALASDDSETSHYVASIVTDVKGEFKETVQKMKEKLQWDDAQAEWYKPILQYMDEFLKKRVLTDLEQKTYVEEYVRLMDELHKSDPNQVSGQMIQSAIEHLLYIQNPDQARIWTNRALIDHPNELASFKGALKFYFDTKDRQRFFEVLNQLKSSEIELDRESLEWVRFYA
ncbi:MAG TPA: hypothetical protein DHN33_08285 [Eubacteriaceae bacterium]|nr:hypothetical protein [Eubacteriaceae bacterium]